MSTSALPPPSKGHRAETFSVDGHGRVHIGDINYYGNTLPFNASPIHDKNLGGANRQAYTVGWICAVKTEYVAACELLDEEYPPLPTVSSHDSNVYTLGRIGDHHVVVACHPNGRYGIASAATVAKNMLRSFESVRIGLIVGIGGGAPSQKNDIRLGDVVVGCPTMGRTGGVLSYDFDKAVHGEFEITGSLNIPPPILLTTLNRLEMLHERKGHRIAETVRKMVRKNPRVRKRYQYPGQEKDRWYESSYCHIDASVNCDSACNRTVPPMIQRKQRSIGSEEPVVHYGIIASADQLMNDAVVRDRMCQKHEVACFEVEAAGSSDAIPCVVIRGICDYSDSHKDDEWHGYAAATAASYARELLQNMSGSGVIEHIRVLDQVSNTGFPKPKTPSRSISEHGPSRSIGHARTQEQVRIQQKLSLEASELALAIPSLSAGFEKIACDIDRVSREVPSAPLMMISIAEQCSTVCATIAQLQSLNRQITAVVRAQHHQVINALESIMIGCKGTLSLIEEYTIDPWPLEEESLNAKPEQSKPIAITGSVWEGEEMRELLSQLSGYHTSLSKLLDAIERQSVNQMHEHIVNQTAILDDLLERSRNSWKRKPPSMLSKSLEFSILSDSNAFSTTTWNFDNEKDEPPATSFLFDHELNNTKVYRRAILNRLRKSSSQNSSKQLIDEPNIIVASDVSDVIKHVASHPKPHLPFTGNAMVKKISSSVLGRPQSLEKVRHLVVAGPFLAEYFACIGLDLTHKVYFRLPFTKKIYTLRAQEKPYQVVPEKWLSQYMLTFKAATPRAGAPRLCRVLLFGSGAVGKSPLAIQFVFSHYFEGTEYDPTIEDNYSKRCVVDEELVDLHITDLSGQFDYSELWEPHIRTCDCFLLIYDITSGDSFREIRMFQEHICSIRIDKNLPFILVGNKCDLYHRREVSSTEGHELAKEIGCPFFEASAKRRVNVDEVFHEAVRKTRSPFHWIRLS